MNIHCTLSSKYFLVAYLWLHFDLIHIYDLPGKLAYIPIESFLQLQ